MLNYWTHYEQSDAIHANSRILSLEINNSAWPTKSSKVIVLLLIHRELVARSHNLGAALIRFDLTGRFRWTIGRWSAKNWEANESQSRFAAFRNITETLGTNGRQKDRMCIRCGASIENDCTHRGAATAERFGWYQFEVGDIVTVLGIMFIIVVFSILQ